MLKFIIAVLIIVIAFGLYDHFIGFRITPKFYKISSLLCITKWRGITLPPVGIFICPERFGDELVRHHEFVHWDQYRRFGTFGFYIRYVHGWVAAGFSYTNNWMEEEARRFENSREQ